MELDAKTVIETFQVIGALFTCVSAGIELFKKKEPQKLATERVVLPVGLCHSR